MRKNKTDRNNIADIFRRHIPVCHSKTCNDGNKKTVMCSNSSCRIRGQCGFFNVHVNIHDKPFDGVFL